MGFLTLGLAQWGGWTWAGSGSGWAAAHAVVNGSRAERRSQRSRGRRRWDLADSGGAARRPGARDEAGVQGLGVEGRRGWTGPRLSDADRAGTTAVQRAGATGGHPWRRCKDNKERERAS